MAPRAARPGDAALADDSDSPAEDPPLEDTPLEDAPVSASSAAAIPGDAATDKPSRNAAAAARPAVLTTAIATPVLPRVREVVEL